MLRALHEDLSAVLTALEDLVAAEPVRERHSVTTIENLLSRGNAGLDRIRGRHPGRPSSHVRLRVAVEGRPGELALLLGRLQELEVGSDEVTSSTSEDLGTLFAEFGVTAVRAESLRRTLSEDGWNAERVHPIPAPGSGDYDPPSRDGRDRSSSRRYASRTSP
ncbi:hypothetical protein JOL79_26860 [Microbispora sp. RL4-1S]|uniref:ACT domain-containing protein n=1 Tax=Microbispora oryzae TaxID=2806554 RepID=A0A941AKP7_9ACTN|nr:hypothetical protein [Microbispora oryzae]MBP2707411.1 hypothetical protein [Microbispora oryzae]